MDIVILVNIFNCYGSILSMFPENEKRKNCFLAACKIWDENINLEEINQKFPHGGLIGYGNSFLDFFFARLKVFRLLYYTILLERLKQLQTRDQDTVTCYQIFQAHVSWDI